MSTGFAAIPLLKAAPEPDQIADRLSRRRLARARALPDALPRGGRCRAAAGDRGHGRAIGGRDVVVTAEAPVAWPSGAFVRVDRLDDEARAGIERSAEFAAGIGSPRAHDPPLHPDVARRVPRQARAARTRREIERFLQLLRARLPRPGRHAADRERAAGTAHAHGRRLPVAGRRPLARPARVARARAGAAASRSTPRTPRCSATSRQAYPSLFGLESADELELERYVEELGPASEVAHVSDAHGLLGEGLPVRQR